MKSMKQMKMKMMNTTMAFLPCMAMIMCCLLCSLGSNVQAAPSSSSAPSPATTDCVASLLTLSDCIEYVTGNGSVAPTAACCKELSGVINGEPICLCQLYNTTLVDQFGLQINFTAATSLPNSCNLTTPPVSQCEAVGIHVPGSSASAPTAISPVSSPVSSPTTSPTTSPSASLAPSPIQAPSPAIDVTPGLSPLSEAPSSSSSDCLTTLTSLADCFSYVTGNGSAPPEAACCKELSTVINDEPICLCQLFNTTLIDSFGININLTAATALPAACSLDAPPASTCSALGFDVGAPGSAPAASSGDGSSPVSSPPPSTGTGTGTPSSPASPSSAPSSSCSNSMVALASMVVLLSIIMLMF